MVTLIPNPLNTWFCTYPVYFALFGEGPRSYHHQTVHQVHRHHQISQP